eukprot:TRINITY_DN6186_c0_g1_i5.p1 TRINITY_DN6186_c0_g1~~TRINITY_DN6186_c0_g1_i5.p1  ORF type:complete len:529 (-),score=42.30 TRINITY_DN6186_c0_g1_i5:365-1837(-)
MTEIYDDLIMNDSSSDDYMILSPVRQNGNPTQQNSQQISNTQQDSNLSEDTTQNIVKSDESSKKKEKSWTKKKAGIACMKSRKWAGKSKKFINQDEKLYKGLLQNRCEYDFIAQWREAANKMFNNLFQNRAIVIALSILVVMISITATLKKDRPTDSASKVETETHLSTISQEIHDLDRKFYSLQETLNILVIQNSYNSFFQEVLEQPQKQQESDTPQNGLPLGAKVRRIQEKLSHRKNQSENMLREIKETLSGVESQTEISLRGIYEKLSNLEQQFDSMIYKQNVVAKKYKEIDRVYQDLLKTLADLDLNMQQLQKQVDKSFQQQNELSDVFSKFDKGQQINVQYRENNDDFNEDDYYELRVECVRDYDNWRKEVEYGLIDVPHVHFSLLIDYYQSQYIQAYFSIQDRSQNDTYDTWAHTLKCINSSVQRVLITNFDEECNVFKAQMQVRDSSGQVTKLDNMRPSVSTNIALRLNAPIYLSKELWEFVK